MNKNGLCREAGLIIIRLNQLKPFLKYPPGSAGLKIHLREVYHDSKLVSLETDDMTVENVHVYLSGDATYMCVSVCRYAFIFVVNLSVYKFGNHFGTQAHTQSRVTPFLFF